MSEEEAQAAPVSDTVSGETSDQTATVQQEDEQQPQEDERQPQEDEQQAQEAANEQGESGANSEQQEEQVGKSVVEERNDVKDSEGEEGKERATKDSEEEGGKEGEKEEARREEEGTEEVGKEGEKEEARTETEGTEEGEEEKEKTEKELEEGNSQQTAAAEGGIAEPEESTVTTEEQTDGGEKGGGDEVIEEGGSEGGRGEDGDKDTEDEGRGREVVMGEASTAEERPTSEVDGDVAMKPADDRLVSASKMAVQPSPLENITEEDEDVEEDIVNREELLMRCKEALHEQCRLRNENLQLQHKIAEYLRNKKVEEKVDPGRNVTDQEKRYLQCMSALDQLEVELEQVKADWLSRVEEMRALCDSRQREVEQEQLDFLKYQREGASEAVDSRSGRKLSSTDISKMQSVQQTKDQAVLQARLENIKLTNKIERLNALLKQKEELAEGLHMIDFEQLKISNVDLGEKVEERNEDITKLTGKVRATVEVLTHVKEKLHFLQDENEKKKEHLELLDSELAKRRDVLTRLKQVRDSLRLDNQRLRQRGGLVCHTGLLRDFEDRQDQNAELQSRLDGLKSQHTQNSMQCAGLRRKIENARHLHHHLH